MKKLLMTLTLVILFITGTLPVHAAKNSAYGFTYDDSADGKTVYRFYSYNSKAASYEVTREFYSRGQYVYTSNGLLLCNTSYASGSRYNGFDATGKFYIIGTNGSLTVVDTKNKTKVLINSGARYLSYNNVDIAITVTTTNGTLSLSTLKPVASTDTGVNTTPVQTPAKNRVEIYTNSAGEMVQTAYKHNKVKTKIIVSSDGKVLNATNKVRLSDSLNGAKFLGFDKSYNLYLTEGRNLYRFRQGKWYSAERLALKGILTSFKRDDAGFIEKIVTSSSSYSIKQLASANRWKASKTYCVRKSNYVTLYTKGSTASNTLALKSGKLYLNGKNIATKVKKYGFTSSRKIIYIKGSTAYTASLSKPTKAKKLCSKAKNLSRNSLGLVTKVTLSKGSRKVS